MNARTPLSEWPVYTHNERAYRAVGAAVMARNTARIYRANADEEAARAAFERAYGYLDLARRWRDGR